MIVTKIRFGIAMSIAMCLLSSCVSVQPYQKMHLNDKEMALGDKKLETFENNFEAYREGAAGANGGKVGGGCGCN